MEKFFFLSYKFCSTLGSVRFLVSVNRWNLKVGWVCKVSPLYKNLQQIRAELQSALIGKIEDSLYYGGSLFVE